MLSCLRYAGVCQVHYWEPKTYSHPQVIVHRHMQPLIQETYRRESAAPDKHRGLANEAFGRYDLLDVERPPFPLAGNSSLRVNKIGVGADHACVGMLQ